jgi:N-acetylmuramoyl-L-alanine amidase
MPSKYTYLLDPGHSGMVNGVYKTPGKRSPKFEDGSVLYEGVNNRDNVNRILKACDAEGINAIDIVNSNEDVPLTERVKRANLLAKSAKCVYISIHSDANGDGVSWDQASGLSVYTSPGQTNSDKFAQLTIDALQENFKETVKWRTDNTDKDEDKEANFYVLEKTTCASILMELGFHTNKDEAKKMLTEEWKNNIVKSVISAIKKWEELNK